LSVDHVLVEGKLDKIILAALLGGEPTVEPGGSKRSLRPQAANLAKERHKRFGYIRDRDFDFDPAEDQTSPVSLQMGEGNVWGWHWCRHEIENYLLEPQLVCEAVPAIHRDAYEQHLRDAAREIRFYEAARWAIGIGRRSLPPNYELETRPSEIVKREMALPEDYSFEASLDWAVTTSNTFLSKVSSALAESSIQDNFQTHCDRFNDIFLDDVDLTLLWFSGKDLLAAMSPWLVGQGFPDPGVFRKELRQWCRHNGDRVLDVVPEWRALVSLLRD